MAPDSFRLLMALAGPPGLRAMPDLLEAARLSQARITKDLRVQARRAVEGFLQGVLDHPANAHALHLCPQLAGQLWQESLILIYRLLFIFKLESSAGTGAFSFAATALWRNALSPGRALAPLVRRHLDLGHDTGRMLEDGIRSLFRVFARRIVMQRALHRNARWRLVRHGRHANARPSGVWRTRGGAGARPPVMDRPARRRTRAGAIWPAGRRGSRPCLRGVARARTRHFNFADGAAAPCKAGSRRAGAGDCQESSAAARMQASPAWKPSRRVASICVPASAEKRPVPITRRMSSCAIWCRRRWAPPSSAAVPTPIRTPPLFFALKIVDPAMGSGHFLVEACRYLGETLYAACRLCDERDEWRPRLNALPDPDRTAAYIFAKPVERRPRQRNFLRAGSGNLPASGRGALPVRRGSQSIGRGTRKAGAVAGILCGRVAADLPRSSPGGGRFARRRILRSACNVAGEHRAHWTRCWRMGSACGCAPH